MLEEKQAQSVNYAMHQKADLSCTENDAIEARADLVGDGHTEAAILRAAIGHKEGPKVVYQER